MSLVPMSTLRPSSEFKVYEDEIALRRDQLLAAALETPDGTRCALCHERPGTSQSEDGVWACDECAGIIVESFTANRAMRRNQARAFRSRNKARAQGKRR